MEKEYTLVQTLHYHRFNIMNVFLLIILVTNVLNFIRKVIKDYREYERYKQCNGCYNADKWGGDSSISVNIENSRVRSIFSTFTRSDRDRDKSDN